MTPDASQFERIKEVKCTFLIPIVTYLENTHGQSKAETLLNEIGLSSAYIKDRDNWLCWQDYENLIHTAIGSNDSKKVISEISLSTLNKGVLGGLWYIVFAHVTTLRTALKKAINNMHLFNRAADWNIIELSDNKCVLEIKWKEGIVPSKETCLHRHEIISSSATLWGMPPATYRELQCASDGHSSCIEEYRWHNKPKVFYSLALASAYGALLFVSGMHESLKPELSAALAVIAFLSGMVIDNRKWISSEKETCAEQSTELSKSMSKIEEKYDELKSAHGELNTAYDRLIEGQHLESLKLIAGGVAHDYNNILTGIKVYLELSTSLLKQGKDGKKVIEFLDSINSATHQAQRLTNQLLAYSKEGTPVERPTSLNSMLKESVSFSLSGSNIKPFFDIEENLWSVNISKGQLGQLISNLTINAVQAMPSGGDIYVSANNKTVNATTNLEHVQIPKGDYVYLVFRDTGVGINKKDIPKIFDLYFTTKQTGNGLGLATVNRIVNKANGRLFVESEVNKGTAFHIYLPSYTDSNPDSLTEELLPIYGQGYILTMDEEQLVHGLLNKILNYLGYDVDVVSNADDAISKYRAAFKSEKPYDAVIIDLNVPGDLGWKDVIATLQKIDPHVKAIAATENHSDPLLTHYSEYGFVGCLEKPFNLAMLSSQIYDAVTM